MLGGAASPASSPCIDGQSIEGGARQNRDTGHLYNAREITWPPSGGGEGRLQGAGVGRFQEGMRVYRLWPGGAGYGSGLSRTLAGLLRLVQRLLPSASNFCIYSV